MPTIVTTPDDLADYYTAGEVDALLATRDKVIVDLSKRVAALEGKPPAPPPVPVPTGAVTRAGYEMMRNGARWRPLGINAQTLLHGDSFPQIDRLFKAFPRGSLFRTFFLSNPQAPMRVDMLQQVLMQARAYEHVLMVALSNGAYNTVSNDPWRDGVVHDAAWYAGGWRGQLLPHFDRTVTPLAGATNVIWQCMNEVGQAGGHGLTVAKAQDFQHAICSEIKARAPNHLVFGGVQDAYQGRFVVTAADYAEVHNSPATDGTTFHEYESVIPYRNYGVANRFRGFQAAMRAINKILIVGEYGVGDGSLPTDAATRATRARAKTLAYREAEAVSLAWAVAEPWAKPEPITGAGAWERVDSPVVAAIAAA